MRLKIDIKFIKRIAKDAGHNITNADAKKAHACVMQYLTMKDDYYYQVRDYFRC